MCLRTMEEGGRLQIMVHKDTTLRAAGWEKAFSSQGKPRLTSLVLCKMDHYKSPSAGSSSVTSSGPDGQSLVLHLTTGDLNGVSSWLP